MNITDAYKAIESFNIRHPDAYEGAVVNFARVLEDIDADIDADELALAEEEADELATV